MGSFLQNLYFLADKHFTFCESVNKTWMIKYLRTYS